MQELATVVQDHRALEVAYQEEKRMLKRQVALVEQQLETMYTQWREKVHDNNGVHDGNRRSDARKTEPQQQYPQQVPPTTAATADTVYRNNTTHVDLQQQLQRLPQVLDSTMNLTGNLYPPPPPIIA